MKELRPRWKVRPLGPLGFVLLVAALVLCAGAVWGQTVTISISPTEAQTLKEGRALKVTLTVSGLSAGRVASIDFPNTGRTATRDDFEVYQQAAEPSGSDTPLTLEAIGDYYYYDFATDSDPTGPVDFWILAKTDTVLVDTNLLIIQGIVINLSPFEEVADSSPLKVTLTDATPIPDPTDKPTTPANFTATVGKGAVLLTWDAIDDTSNNTNFVNDVQITKHQVRQTTDSDITDETWTDIPNSAYGEANANSYTIGSLTDGTEYTFQVRAVNGCTVTTGCGNSDAATAIMATPDTAFPAAPAGLPATAGNAAITLAWTDPDDTGIHAYEYQEKVGTQDFGEWTALPLTSPTDLTHRFTGLENGTVYTYRMRSLARGRTSLVSGSVTATPQGAVPEPIALTATPRHGGVTLTWPNPRDPTIEEYRYQYRTGADLYGLWTEIEETGPSGFSIAIPPHVDTSGATIAAGIGGLANGTAYTFRVQAHNADGATVSNEVTVTPAAVVPAKPTGLEYYFRTSRQWLQWDPEGPQHHRARVLRGRRSHMEHVYYRSVCCYKPCCCYAARIRRRGPLDEG